MSEHTLDQLFSSAYPALAPSENARRRVVDAALVHDRQTQRRAFRRDLWRVAFGTAVGVGAIAATFFFTSKPASAALMQKVASAMDDAKRVHMVSWSITQDGKRLKSREMWYEGGKWRLETPARKEILIHDGNKQWTYFPAQATVYTEIKPGGPYANNPSGWNMSALIGDHRKWGGFKSVTVTDKGQNKQAVMLNDKEHIRVTVLFNGETNLPISVEQEALTAKSWQKMSEMEFEFNGSIPASTFAPVFPAGTTRVDLAAGKAAWQRKFDGEIGRIGKDGRLVVRDIQVTPNGHVFVLYTSKSSWDRNVDLRDSLGTPYGVADHNFQPYIEDTSGKMVRGFKVKGAKLQGMWFIPTEELKAGWKERTLTFELADVHYVPLDKVRKQIKAGTYPHKTVGQDDMREVRTPVGKWSLKVTKPTCPSIPLYMQFMASGPNDEWDVQYAETDVRWRHAWKSGDNGKAIAHLEERVRLVEEWEQERGEERICTRDYFQIYLLLKSEGRRSEGIPWLKKAMNEPQGFSGEDPNLERALREEGLK